MRQDYLGAGYAVITDQERVLFWHTGGTPALFTYEDQLLGAD